MVLLLGSKEGVPGIGIVNALEVVSITNALEWRGLYCAGSGAWSMHLLLGRACKGVPEPVNCPGSGEAWFAVCLEESGYRHCVGFQLIGSN